MTPSMSGGYPLGTFISIYIVYLYAGMVLPSCKKSSVGCVKIKGGDFKDLGDSVFLIFEKWSLFS